MLNISLKTLGDGVFFARRAPIDDPPKRRSHPETSERHAKAGTTRPFAPIQEAKLWRTGVRLGGELKDQRLTFLEADSASLAAGERLCLTRNAVEKGRRTVAKLA